MKRHFRELSVALALGALLLFIAVAAPAFYQPQPLLSLLAREAPTLVVACGMALVIIGRQIDISVGSMVGLSTAVMAVCLEHKLPVEAAMGFGRLSSDATAPSNTSLIATAETPPSTSICRSIAVRARTASASAASVRCML